MRSVTTLPCAASSRRRRQLPRCQQHGDHYRTLLLTPCNHRLRAARAAPSHLLYGVLSHQVYQKERHEFGRSVNNFSLTDASILDEFLSSPDVLGEHMERSPTILDIQAIPQMSETYVNTETVSYRSAGMLHIEGGWPKDVDSTEKDQTQCAFAARPGGGEEATWTWR